MFRERLVLTAVFAVGCLEDLPEPLECPPPAVRPEGDCTDIQPPLTGCFPPLQHACLAGQRTSCACGENECAPVDDACFPSGTCPADVVSTAGSDVTCGRFASDDIGDLGLVPPGFACTCGCTDCMFECDGKGPTFGAALDRDGLQDEDDFIVPLFRVDRLLPSAGRFGVYVRLRGLNRTQLAVFTGDPDGGGSLTFARSAVVPAAPGEGFVGHVLYDEFFDAEGGTFPLEWTSPADRPSIMALLPQLDRNAPAYTLFEVDCVIPFWRR